MIPRSCDYEPALREALRNGSLDSVLCSRLETCVSCRETQQAVTLLLQHAVAVHASADLSQLPSAAAVWQRAQQHRQATVLHRAALAIRALRALAAVYLVALLAWFLHAVSVEAPLHAQLSLASLTSGAVPLGAIAALLLLITGASSLLLLHRRQLLPLLP